MDLIVLGGNNRSPNNRDWVQNITSFLQQNFSSVYPHAYHHWEAKEKIIDLDYELKVLSEVVKNKQQYIILAKSAGVLLTLKGIFTDIFTPSKCIFLGTPIDWAKKHNFDLDTWLKNYSTPSLFIQKSYDPVALFQDLKKHLDKMEVQNYQLAEIPGKDHDYGNFEELNKIITPFIKTESPKEE